MRTLHGVHDRTLACAQVSRLSAHHHFGMVSPFRVAAEAHAQGAAKFVDDWVLALTGGL